MTEIKKLNNDSMILYNTMLMLTEILITLKEMKQQEYEYWETWKKSKENKNGIPTI